METTPQKTDTEVVKKENGFWASPQKEWKKNVVTDPSAPELYSKAAIYGFSLFFSGLFGAILLAINLNRSGKKKGIVPVLAFGIGFIIAIVLASPYLSQQGMGFIFGIIAGLILNQIFWKKYLGEVQYRARSIWAPLIIGLLLVIILILLMKLSGQPL